MKKENGVKKFFFEFKKFITKGNIVDLALAVIIGGAFGKIVTSLVNDIIMPLITLAVGGVSVADWKWIIKPAQYTFVDGVQTLVSAETALMYGNFLQTILDFLIISFFIFLALKFLLGLQGKLNKLSNELISQSRAEQRAFVKELKKAGKSKFEIREILSEREAEILAAAKTKEEERLVQEAEARPETSEEILKDIRELLKEQRSPKSSDGL